MRSERAAGAAAAAAGRDVARAAVGGQETYGCVLDCRQACDEYSAANRLQFDCRSSSNDRLFGRLFYIRITRRSSEPGFRMLLVHLTWARVR